MRRLSASEFKAKCLALLDEVRETGEALVITKRGAPVARLVPVTDDESDYPQAGLAGTVETVGDVVSPVLPSDAWEAEGRREDTA
jgi:prevent-host-death family protein